MDRKTSKLVMPLCVLALIIGFVSGSLASMQIGGHVDPKVKVNVFILAETSSGTEVISSGNLITNIGDAFVASLVGLAGEANTTSRNATQYISISNDASPLATWTKLTNEVAANGFTRATGTVSALWLNGADYAFNVTKTFAATGTQQVQMAGLQWSGVASSDNNLFAAAAFTQTTFNAGDNCTIVWSITFTH